MELFGATTITRKTILEGGLVVVDDGSGSGSGAAVGDNDAPLTVFEITNHYDYYHTSYTDFATSSECFAFKSGLPWYLVDEVYIPINCGDEFHWVLIVVVLKERRIRVYDSMSRRRRSRPSSEIQKLAKILPTYLDIIGFWIKKQTETLHNATDDTLIAIDNESATTDMMSVMTDRQSVAL
ncbi:hypothetical protein BC332_29916 [Capsicum chinense]|nr:hypothetical protein BC332_29916 [Capsicum chinense]